MDRKLRLAFLAAAGRISNLFGESVGWAIHECGLDQICGLGSNEGPSVRDPTVAVYGFKRMNWSLLVAVLPRQFQFQAVLAAYPSYVDGYARCRDAFWTQDVGAIDNLLAAEIGDWGIELQAFPDNYISVSPESRLFGILGRRARSRRSPFSVTSLLIPSHSTDSVIAYLNKQLSQFQAHAFFRTHEGGSSPLQWDLITGKQSLEESPSKDWLLAFGIPPSMQTSAILQSARTILNGLLLDTRWRGVLVQAPVFRPSAIFARAGRRSRLLPTRRHPVVEDREFVDLQHDCNLLRAQFVASLSWPELYESCKLVADEPDGDWSVDGVSTELPVLLRSLCHRQELEFSVISEDPFPRSF
jgi:hypothetical protein